MDIANFYGKLYFELGLEALHREIAVGSYVLTLAYGFYQKNNNLEGKQACLDILKEIDNQALDSSQGYIDDVLNEAEHILKSKLGTKLMSTPAGRKVLKNKIKTRLRPDIECMIAAYRSNSQDVRILLGNVYYEKGLETVPRHEELGRALVKIAYGFYRDSEYTCGMQECKKYLGDDLDHFIQNKSFEDAVKQLAKLNECVRPGVLEIIMQDPEHRNLLRDEINAKLEKDIESLIKQIEESEA